MLGIAVSGAAFAADKIPRPKVKPPVPPITEQAPPDDAAVPPPPGAAADKPAPKQSVKSSHETTLPLPRFASMRKGEAYVRVGPGTRFPIDWVFTRKDMPVEILAENDVWRQIRDWEGTVGWVQSSQLAGRRMVTIKGEVGTLRNDPSPTRQSTVPAGSSRRARSTMVGSISSPTTSSPSAASVRASRPVPQARSSTGPPIAFPSAR